MILADNAKRNCVAAREYIDHSNMQDSRPQIFVQNHVQTLPGSLNISEFTYMSAE